MTTAKGCNPVLRNAFQVETVGGGQGGIVRYGDKVRFVAYVNDRKVIVSYI